MEKQRIDELDIVRGVCILGVLLSHAYYDLTEIAGLSLTIPAFFTVLFEYGGILFILLSGVCATLGSHSVRRGAAVLGCGLLITAVTLGLRALTGSQTFLVQFGILHLLGMCMLLYPLTRRLPSPLLAICAAVLIALGFWFDTLRVGATWLFPLGLTTTSFFSADYWPLFPNLGYFLLGILLGRTVYRDRQPKIPALQGRGRFLAFCGRHSLPLYLLQQPVIFLLIVLFASLFGIPLR
ncbi:MAG: heparan-alpha-glucosaminide N-acetyltransferase [Oscillospiraceae bacterium]|nr:heparan-alpha-glucosaminide N-acetyltransferase [Oscillospiraceae bacterium]